MSGRRPHFPPAPHDVRLDPDVFDDENEFETVCRAIGMTNTMVWQFYPGE